MSNSIIVRKIFYFNTRPLDHIFQNFPLFWPNRGDGGVKQVEK